MYLQFRIACNGDNWDFLCYENNGNYKEVVFTGTPVTTK